MEPWRQLRRLSPTVSLSYECEIFQLALLQYTALDCEAEGFCLRKDDRGGKGETARATE